MDELASEHVGSLRLLLVRGVRTFFVWLTRPPLAVRLLQDENARLVAEVHRLNDILTQAWEQSRVVPRQPEHIGPSAPPVEHRKTMGEMQAKYQAEETRKYAEWRVEETERLRRVHPAPSAPPS